MKCHNTGVNDANNATIPNMNHQDKPAKNSTAAPELATNSEVPKSGCFAINNTGKINSVAAPSTCLGLGGKARSDRYQATIIGALILVNSEG